MKILIVKRDKLGDMLLTTPLIAHLRRSLQDAEISVLAAEYCGWVVREDPAVSRLWTYPRLRIGSILKPSQVLRYLASWRQIRAERFDVAIAAGGEYSPRAVRKALEVRAQRTIAYAPRNHRHGARLTDALEPPSGGHEIDRMLALAAPLGLGPPATEIDPSYRLPADARAFAERWLAERSLRPGGFVVLGLGARRASRQPSPEQVLRWSARWLEQRGLQTVFMWTPGRGSPLYPGDDETAAPVLAAGRADIHPFRGPIREALGLLWSAAASVFPDSGLMHFAATSPGGVVGLYAGSAEQWGPRGPRARWVGAAEGVPRLADEALFRELQELL